MSSPVKLSTIGFGAMDGRLVLALVDYLRTIRGQVQDDATTLSDAVAQDAPLILPTLHRYGLDDSDAYMLFDLVGSYLSELLRVDMDHTAFSTHLAALPKWRAMRLLNSACEQLQGCRLADY